ncbi:hypothetical protein [Caulobacter rhizosphaerae]|jgi:hypothetical protein|uniref:hypothetical protein n=1 Tax=Caulobacter rhizosphaerae TaxID=2010972 RepID=UPI0013D856AD|nr:hypothetical protein [Caulobacter rhizosphaerae]GGL43735.1 hypothetical protein GCM10010983_46310 [Caulobacter rhizosphaerae]
MPRLKFDQLLSVYRATQFSPDGRSGNLTILDDGVLATLRLLDTDEDALQDSGIGMGATDPATLSIGDVIQVDFTSPRIGLGSLVKDFDTLVKSSSGYIEEPSAYFVVDGAYYPGGGNPPDWLVKYRKTLKLISLLSQAASYLDRTKQAFVFVRKIKTVIPIRYNAAMLGRVSAVDADRFLGLFADEAHKDQKLEILSEAIVRLCEAQPVDDRFRTLLENLGTLADAVRDGYKLFASSFSYSKIKGELEAAKIEYVTKIHKTIVDVQAQLLGIPVASVIVASQLKTAQSCGPDLWTDVAVISGAWIFLILLVVALVNQLLTLNTICAEINRQRSKLVKDYADLGQTFTRVFDGLIYRICWHRAALAIVGTIAILGACFATVAFDRVVSVEVGSCLTGKVPMVFPPLKP